MAKTLRDNYDLRTLATKIIPDGNGGFKNAIVGAEIVFVNPNDGNDIRKEVEDWHFMEATCEIHLKFTDGESDVLNLKRTYQVYIDDGYKSVKANKKRRRGKRTS